MTFHPDLVTPDGQQRMIFHSSERMRELEDASVNLTVTSPPYGLGRAYASLDDFQDGQKEIAIQSMEAYRKFLNGLKPIWREVYRVTRPGGYIVINSVGTHAKSEYFGESFVLPIPDDIAYFFRFDLGAQFKWEYVWFAARARQNSAGMPVAFLGSYPKPVEGQVLRETETIQVFRKVPFTPADLWYGDRKQRRARSVIGDSDWRKIFSQTWDFPGAKKEADGEVEHPAPFPLELPRRAILGYSVVGDLVLDPFGGTGTTLLACRLNDRRGVSYEIEPRFAGLVENKLKVGEVSMEEEW